MGKAQLRELDLRLGLIILGVVAAGFLALFLFGPSGDEARSEQDRIAAAPGLLDRLPDAATAKAANALQVAAPGAFARLDLAAKRAIIDGADEAELSQLLLEALFSQFSSQASAIKVANSNDYQRIMAGLATGLRALEASESQWCEGTHVAAYLSQNEEDLVPSLLAEFPYGSPQYQWAMDWMAIVLNIAESARARPERWPSPNLRDEAILQEQGLALGSEQWTLALQVAAFANSEGVSYARMQEVIEGMDVCALGIAVETVSDRIPDEVRGRIWSDLMPEIMIGNTPYVMYRVTDYFFIG